MSTRSWLSLTLLLAVLTLMVSALPSSAERLKDMATLKGVRQNQLIGYGLVVGLQNSGDKSYKSPFTIQTLLSMLEKLGTTVEVQQLVNSRTGVSDIRRLQDVRVENVAAVMVTANLPSFARQGSRIDITVSSLGDARSLKGGTLLLTPLKAANGEVFAVGQGAVSVGGGYFEKARRVSSRKNHPTVGRITGGALVEAEVGFDFESLETLQFSLSSPDFTTSIRVVNAINASLGIDAATALDPGTIEVSIPAEFANKKVELVAQLEVLDIDIDSSAKVVLDERTGTIVIGENVKIDKVAISHGNLTIKIGESTRVSQPAPFSGGEALLIPQTTLNVAETGGKSGRVMLIDSGVNIGDMVKALNNMGISPRDLITIFQILKSAGALHAQLEII